MADGKGYWVVEFEAFAFETEEAACNFRDALVDAFCAMPEAGGYGAGARIRHEPDDEVEAPVENGSD